MNRKRVIWLLAACGLLLAVLLAVYVPSSESKKLAAVCRLEARTAYALPIPGGDTLYLAVRPDAECQAAFCADSVSLTLEASGAFVSGRGHLLTTADLLGGCADTLRAAEVRRRLAAIDTLLERRRATLRDEQQALDEYASTHSVVDDGFNQVMAYASNNRCLLAATDSLHRCVRRLLQQPQVPQAVMHVRAVLANDSASLKPLVVVSRSEELLLLAVPEGRLPQGFRRVTVGRFGSYNHGARLLAFNDFGAATRTAAPVSLSREAPRYALCEGAAWVNASGHLSGVEHRGQRIPSARVGAFLASVHSEPVWWWLNASAWVRRLLGRPARAQQAAPKAASADSLVCRRVVRPDSLSYEGQVSATCGKRQGWGVCLLSDGTRFEGRWDADTLVWGERRDSVSRYVGSFNAAMQPHGMGRETLHDGEVYEGEWTCGKRAGHGFAVRGSSLVRCGWWKKGRFSGERMVYTSDRVYGIDISRYQHEHKKARYGIDWKRVRITSLGPGRRVQGKVDYPVSFVYTKATEGRSVTNRYYASDMKQVRALGIRAGSYHFFRLTCPGSVQAAFFLKKASIHAKDLPPMLDLEPTDAEIRKAGGEAAMFREVLVWMRAVERACGKRPVLYVGQSFVNNHLNHAPEELRDYEVWIARYGEFKPYVRLLHWQLTPYGRVRGIRGEVDINVFNGTREQFEEKYPL